MRTTPTVPFLLLGLLCAGTATCYGGISGWVKTFRPERLATYLDGQRLRVLVVCPGSCAGAAEPLQAAFRATGRVQVVVDDSALDFRGRTDDQSIVSQAAKLTVDIVAVARVFSGADGSESAVVACYDRAGKVLSGFTIEKGTELPPREAGEAPRPGVSPAAAEAVSEVLHTKPAIGPPPQQAQEEYESQFVGFVDLTGVDQNGIAVAQWQQPFLGKYQKPLDVPEFLEAVDKPDLAAQYRSGRYKIYRLAAVGGGGLGVGAALLLGGIFDGIFSNGGCVLESAYPMPRSSIPCPGFSDVAYGLVGGGAGLMLIGSAVLIAAARVERPRVTSEVARQLADEHNRRLRVRLELPEERAAGAPARSLVLDPGARRAALQLRIAF